IGLTNECNLSCAVCYREASRVDRLDLEQVRAVLDRLPVQSVNLGTGENGMHPRFREMLALLRSRNVKLTMTSNGLSVAALGDDELRAFHDLEFSLDYPTRWGPDAPRGSGCRAEKADAAPGRCGSRRARRCSRACTGLDPATRCRCSSRWARAWSRRRRFAPLARCLRHASRASCAKHAEGDAPAAGSST